MIVSNQSCQTSNSGNNYVNYFVECCGDRAAGNFYPCFTYDSPNYHFFSSVIIL